MLGVKRGFSPNSLKCPLVCDTNIVTGLHQDDRTQMLMTDARPSWFCTTSSLPGLKTSGFFVGNCQRNTDEQRERSINILRRITSPELGIDNQKKIIQIRRDSCTNILFRRILVYNIIDDYLDKFKDFNTFYLDKMMGKYTFFQGFYRVSL